MPRIYSLSESSISIEFGNEIDVDINRRGVACRDLILQGPFDGLIEVVAAYTTTTVFYDPLIVSQYASPHSPAGKVHEILKEIIGRLKENEHSPAREVVSIPVCYDEELAPDLQWVADFHRVSKNDIVKKHVDQEYSVFMIGFMPGFPYLGILPPGLDSPRKQTPRTLVPAGSVGIAGRQTGIYPFDSPGGWQIIGRTPLKIFLPNAQRRALLCAGDRVRFVSISKDEFKQMAGS